MPDRNAARAWKTPSEDQLGLRRIGNDAGLSIKLLPNGCLFAIEHEHAGAVIRVTQVAGSPLEGGIGRLLIRVAREPVDKADPGQAAAMATHFEAVGPRAQAAVVAAGDRVAWCSEVEAVSARVTLLVEEGRAVEGGVEEGGVEEGRAVEGGVEEGRAAWQWQVDLVNRSSAPVALDSILIQDLGLASPGFLANNEAYASQYTDHHVAQHPVFGPVVMSRQNLAQGGRNPWIAHGCLEGAAGFATDALQVFGPAWRDGAAVFPPCGTPLPSCRLQHEMACAAIQSPIARLPAGGRVRWRFFALYLADHPAASSDADLAAVEQVAWSAPALPRDAPPVQAAPEKPQGTPQAAVTSSHAPVRRLEERDGEDLWSFFVPAGTLNRHVVLHDKECRITRRHGSLLRSGRSMLPDEDTLCATVWMHGIFGAQLTIGNTSLHKL